MHQNEWTVHHHGKDICMFTIKCSCIPGWLLNFFMECWDCVTASVGKENERKQMIFRIKCYTIQGTPINLVILPVKMQSRLQMLVPYQLYVKARTTTSVPTWIQNLIIPLFISHISKVSSVSFFVQVYVLK